MTEPKPTLAQITRAVWEVRQELTGGLAEAVVEQRYRAEQAQRRAPCPQCGRPVAARAVVSRTVETVVGEMELSRPYFYCVPWGRASPPWTPPWERPRVVSSSISSRLRPG